MGAPYDLQTQGKIERYHQTMKNAIKLHHDFFLWELEASLQDFVAYYNDERHHEVLDNVSPADAYFGWKYTVVSEPKKIKKRTMRKRQKEYLATKAAQVAIKNCLLAGRSDSMYRSSHPLNGFDALAPLYDHLARWVFGGAILRAQRSQLQTLEESKNLLFIGGGSGEVLAELLRSSPELKVTYIDASSAMIARAQARLSPPELQRVTWVHATHEILLEPSHTQQRYDGVLTYFFLDCLRPDELLTLIDALEPRIRRWSLVDFVPQTRWWARHLITFMYLCSALTTDLPNRRLSPVPDWLKERGWRATRESSFARGLISAATFERPPD